MDDGNRYEIIDGVLHVTTTPHSGHQDTTALTTSALVVWNNRTGAGRVLIAPGVIFAPDQAVAPDIVWVSMERHREVVGADGKLHAAPDLAVEILSPGSTNVRRDR